MCVCECTLSACLGWTVCVKEAKSGGKEWLVGEALFVPVPVTVPLKSLCYSWTPCSCVQTACQKYY